MRILAATTAGAGHLAGLLPFARACVRAGHEVRVAEPASFAGSVTDAGLVHEPFADADPAALGAVFGRLASMTTTEADDQVVQEVFGRLDRDAALPGLRAGGGLAARPRAARAGRARVVRRRDRARHPARADQHRPERAGRPVAALARADPGRRRLPRRAPGRRAALDGRAAVVRVPSTVATGPVRHGREPGEHAVTALPDWWPGDERPLVYVTFGSVAAGIGLFPLFHRRVLEQLADLPARVLLTTGGEADPGELGPLPSHVHVERWWPQRDVLPETAVVVGHGGFGTTQAALAAAVPQVVLPLFSFDPFVNADRVAQVGAGVALVGERRAGDLVPYGPPATDDLLAAVRSALARTEYATTARALAEEIAGRPEVDELVP